MDDLVRWLSAQLDEDQRMAEAARGRGEGRWSHDASYSNGYVYDERLDPVVYDESTPLPEEAAHIAAWDPARVLREIDATRQIVKQHRPVGYGGVCLSLCHTRAPGQPQTWPCLTLRLLALPYADREGYREEWRP